MDRNDGREEEILDWEVNPDRQPISLEGGSSLSILWALWRLPVSTHRLPDSRGIKKRDFGQILKRLGGLEEIPSISMAPSLNPYDYRVRVQLKVKEKAMGYYQERSHKIVEIDRCPVSHPLINQIIQELREELAALLHMEEIEINVSPRRGEELFCFTSFHDRHIEHFSSPGQPILEASSYQKDGDTSVTFVDLTILPSREKRNSVRIHPEFSRSI
jgi:hypothetical protein